MGIKSKIQVKDSRQYRKLKTEVRRGGGTVDVGIFGAKAQAGHDGSGGITVGEVAYIHELGLGVPERSWLRGWYDPGRVVRDRQMRKRAELVASGRMTLKVFLGQYGARFVGEIQQRIANHIPPPLAQSTIDRKGSDTPLIDTGQLRASITWKTYTGKTKKGA